VNVLEAVEVAGGGAEALEVDVERLGGDEVCAAGSDELKVGLDGAVADGSLGVGGEGHVAAEAGVPAEEDETGLAEGDVAPLAAEVERDLAQRRGPAEGSFDLEGAGVGDIDVSACGTGLETEVPLLRVWEPESKVGVGEGDGGFFVVEFEIETGAGGFDVGEARGGAGFFLHGGSDFNVSGVEEYGLKVPFAVGEVNEVDAGGFAEADGGELDAVAQERAEAKGCTDGGGADDGFGAEGGVFVDDEVIEREAGEREKIEADVVEMNGAAEAVADAGGDSFLVAIEADVRRQQNEQQHGEGCESQIENPTKCAAAEGLGVVGLEGFSLLVGGVHFLH